MPRSIRDVLAGFWAVSGRAVRKAVNAVEELVWPKGFQCLCCDRRSYGESLCRECRQNLNDLRLQNEQGDMRSAWKYADSARKLVTELKYNCSGDCAEVLAEGMAEVIRQMKLPDDTVLTWVPMPKRRRRDRGIDHGQELCRCVASKTGMEMRPLLERKGAARTQRGLSKEKRLTNLKDGFRCSERVAGSVLLVDDVLTTGATIWACVDALMSSGATRVYAVTATRAMPADNR